MTVVCGWYHIVLNTQTSSQTFDIDRKLFNYRQLGKEVVGGGGGGVYSIYLTIRGTFISGLLACKRVGISRVEV